MSYSSSYRRLFSDSPRFSTSGSGLRAEGSRSSSSGHFLAPSSGQYQSRRAGGSAVQFHSRSTGGAVSALSLADALDLGHSSKVNNELRVARSNEKQQLQGLNDRFALFIEKVRALESQNRALEAELQCLRQKQAESKVSQVWTDQIQTLRDQNQILNQDLDRVRVEREHQEVALQRLSTKLSEEARLREEAELALRALMKDMDDAAVTRLDLERRVESLNQEINFMKKLHQEEMEELQRDYDNKVAVEAELSQPSLTSDLSSALREIRAQYEAVSLKNQAETESWFRSRCRSLEEAASRSGEVVRQSREEIGDFRRELQSRTIEIQSLRAANDSLERQRRESEERHGQEVTALQETIAHLDVELRDLKGEMAEHLREYQDLLNVKMALDIEIAAYRKLLEGEETHFNSGLSFGAFAEPRAVGGVTAGGGASSRERKPRRDKKEEEEKPEETQSKLLLHE